MDLIWKYGLKFSILVAMAVPNIFGICAVTYAKLRTLINNIHGFIYNRRDR